MISNVKIFHFFRIWIKIKKIHFIDNRKVQIGHFHSSKAALQRLNANAPQNHKSFTMCLLFWTTSLTDRFPSTFEFLNTLRKASKRIKLCGYYVVKVSFQYLYRHRFWYLELCSVAHWNQLSIHQLNQLLKLLADHFRSILYQSINQGINHIVQTLNPNP